MVLEPFPTAYGQRKGYTPEMSRQLIAGPPRAPCTLLKGTLVMEHLPSFALTWAWTGNHSLLRATTAPNLTKSSFLNKLIYLPDS